METILRSEVDKSKMFRNTMKLVDNNMNEQFALFPYIYSVINDLLCLRERKRKLLCCLGDSKQK